MPESDDADFSLQFSEQDISFL